MFLKSSWAASSQQTGSNVSFYHHKDTDLRRNINFQKENYWTTSAADLELLGYWFTWVNDQNHHWIRDSQVRHSVLSFKNTSLPSRENISRFKASNHQTKEAEIIEQQNCYWEFSLNNWCVYRRGKNWKITNKKQKMSEQRGSWAKNISKKLTAEKQKLQFVMKWLKKLKRA